MATQLALQRNFVTITPANQIPTSASGQTNQSTMTTSPAANGEIVSITTTGNPATQSDSNGVHVVATHTQVNDCRLNEDAGLWTNGSLNQLNLLFLQKKYILQAGTTSDGVSIIDVVPIDQSDSTDDAPITVSTIMPTNSAASSPNSSNSQQITAQVAFVQASDTADSSEGKPHFITVNGT